MSDNIKFQKQALNKPQYEKIINTEFTQLGVIPPQDQLSQQTTPTEFFQLYDELFYNIDELGETNSHEYLIKKSSEYIGFNESNELIIALQNEIAQLRIDLLDAQKQIVESQTGTSLNS